MKICISDDNAAECRKLKALLSNTGLLENAEYAFYESGERLIADYKNGLRYDIVFLDVDLPLLCGIEVGKYINSTDPRGIIIFVTSYPQYAIDAFECNAFHYLLKDCDYDKFYSVIFRAVEKHRILHKYYALKTKDGPVTLELSDIFYIECFRKHLLFYTDSATYETRGTIGEALEKTQDFGFCQTHQGFIVNFSKVHHFTKNDVVLVNGMKVMVSVRKRTEVITSYNKYIERYIV